MPQTYRHHTRSSKRDTIVDFIDVPLCEYHLQQAAAARRLKEWFESKRVREDIETIPCDEISGIIEDIGKLFFLDSLKNVSKPM